MHLQIPGQDCLAKVLNPGSAPQIVKLLKSHWQKAWCPAKDVTSDQIYE